MKTITTALILALLAGSAWAAGPASGPDGLMQLDQDHNGSISRQEAAQAGRLQRRFDLLDVNRDGQLSPAELPCAARGPAAADSNKDGQISRKEAGEFRPLAACFDKLDSNKDGVLSRDELRAHHVRPAHHRGHGHGGMGPAAGMGPQQ